MAVAPAGARRHVRDGVGWRGWRRAAVDGRRGRRHRAVARAQTGRGGRGGIGRPRLGGPDSGGVPERSHRPRRRVVRRRRRRRERGRRRRGVRVEHRGGCVAMRRPEGDGRRGMPSHRALRDALVDPRWRPLRRRGVRGGRAERRADDRAPEPEDARARERRWGGDPERAVGRGGRRPNLARVPKIETRNDDDDDVAARFVTARGLGVGVGGRPRREGRVGTRIGVVRTGAAAGRRRGEPPSPRMRGRSAGHLRGIRRVARARFGAFGGSVVTGSVVHAGKGKGGKGGKGGGRRRRR